MPSGGGEKPSRRAFLIRYAGAAFAAPVIVSFALDGVAQASEKHQQHHHGPPKQSHANQVHPHQCCSNQTVLNQCIANQTTEA